MTPFIVFDGPNGSGKTSILEGVQQVLISEGRRMHRTKEPTTHPLGMLARSLDGQDIHPRAYACLIMADRIEHARRIERHLADGETVLCDRYALSTYVLNGLRGVPASFIDHLHEGLLIPDATIVVNAPAEILVQRIRDRGGKTPGEQLTTRQDEINSYEFLAMSPPAAATPTHYIINDGPLEHAVEAAVDIVRTTQ